MLPFAAQTPLVKAGHTTVPLLVAETSQKARVISASGHDSPD
jgi:hypothetical protein